MKLQIWKCCVYTSLMHGLDCTGVSEAGPVLLRKHVARHVRLIAKSPSHITKERSEDLLRRLGIPDPLQDLLRRTEARIQKARQGAMVQLQPPRVQQRWTPLLSSLQALQDTSLTTQRPGTPPHAHEVQARLVEVRTLAKPVACALCGIYFPSLKMLRHHKALKHPETVNKKRPRTQQQMRADFMQHAVDGLPACKHCSWQFSSWPAFCKHFECRRCPVLHAPTAETPEPQQIKHQVAINPDSPNPPSTNQHPEDTLAALFKALPEYCREIGVADVWQTLAARIRQEGINHCPFCAQWLAKPQYLTRHVAAQHFACAELLAQLPEWLEHRRVTVHSPCQWCHTAFQAKHVSRIKHTMHCPILVRTGLLSLLFASQVPAQHHADGTHGGSAERTAVSRGAGSNDAGHDGESVGPDCRDGRTASDGDGTQGAQARGSRGGSGAGTPPRQRSQGPQGRPKGRQMGILEWMGQLELAKESTSGARGRDERRDDRDVSGNGEADASPRRSIEHQQNRDRIRPVLSNKGRSLDGSGHVPHNHLVAAHQRDIAPGTHHLPESDADAEVHGSLVESLGGMHPDGRLQGPGGAAADPERRRQSSVPTVQSHYQNHGSEDGPGAPGARRGQEDDQGSGEAGPTPFDPPQVPPHAEAHGRDPCGRRASYGPSGGPPDGRSRPMLEAPQHPLPFGGMQSGGHEHAGRADGPIGPRRPHPGDDQQTVRALMFGNQANYCYSNAACVALLWTRTHLLPGARSEPLVGDAMLATLHGICRTRALQHIWTRITWRSLHQGWRQPELQHDVIEYFTFLRKWLVPQLSQIHWQARIQDEEGLKVVDTGSCWPLWLPQPLTPAVSTPAAGITVQSLVDAWTNIQRGLHGLVNKPRVLLIQVNRFNIGTSVGDKSHQPVNPDLYIMMPIFTYDLTQPQAMQQRYERYRRTAALLHEGHSPVSGHYRAVLYEDGCALITNDNTQARRLADTTASWQSVNSRVYAVLYVHSPNS